MKIVKRLWIYCFAKNFGSKYGKKFLNKELSTSKRIKNTASKFNQSKYGNILRSQGSEFGKIAGTKIVQKSTEATGDLIGSKIADKINSLKDKSKKLIEKEQEIIIPPH